jgi:hypothetical protein
MITSKRVGRAGWPWPAGLAVQNTDADTAASIGNSKDALRTLASVDRFAANRRPIDLDVHDLVRVRRRAGPFSSTTKSASFPAVIEPFTRSSDDAYAPLMVAMVSASSTVTFWFGPQTRPL